jgi:hypothetical protein
MPDTGPTQDLVEKDFVEALQRLKDGKPANKKLRALCKAGKLRINTSNVALEAGRSRTLIALEACRYPKVREAVKLAQDGKKAQPSTYTQLIENLRATIAELKAEKKLLETTMAAHVLARRKAEIFARRDAAEASRLRKQIVELEKVVHLPHREAALPRLILIRGLPGSGKTTKAMGYVNDGYMHFEADDFFTKDGEYRFDANLLPAAHEWCLNKAREALRSGEFVCVANVFTTIDDLRPYTELGFDYQVVEANYPGKSIHRVPASTIRAMESTWVPTDKLLQELQHKARTNASVTPISSKRGKT